MQPQQKGGILGMWSDADQLAEVNGILFTPLLIHDMRLTL